MENAAFFRVIQQLPFIERLRVQMDYVRDDDPIHADPRQFSFCAAFFSENCRADIGTHFTVDRDLEFARHTGRPNRAITVDEVNAAPERGAPGTQRRPKWLRFFFNAISKLRRGIHAQIETLRIERGGRGQRLIEVVPRHAAIRWNTQVGCEQRGKSDDRRRPHAQYRHAKIFQDSGPRADLRAASHDPAIASVIQAKGKVCVPCDQKSMDATIARATAPIPAKARLPGMPFHIRKASAAHNARITWRKGSQRKLQRKTFALGSIEMTRTRTSKPSSHLIGLTRARPKRLRPASRTIGETKPHAISVAVCGSDRVEKSDQFTVQLGRMKAGSDAGGTSHWKCAELSCAWRAEPCT